MISPQQNKAKQKHGVYFTELNLDRCYAFKSSVHLKRATLLYNHPVAFKFWHHNSFNRAADLPETV